MASESTLRWVTAAWLQSHLDEVAILDCQPNVHDYIRGHVPGAFYLGEESLRLSDRGKPHIWVDSELASAVLSRAGVREDWPVLAYTSLNPQLPTGDGVPQGMIAYSLERYGHRDILLLDGGLEEWRKTGGRIVSDYPKVERSGFLAKVDHSLFVSYEEFVSIKDDEGVVHIDSRPAAQYQGKSPWPKEGHIPGAINVPWSECFLPEDLCRLRPRDEVERRFASGGVTREKRIICHCGSGRKAAAQLMVLKHFLGFPDVRLFEGSFTEWCAHEGNKTVIGPLPWPQIQ